jgi:uncharacterized protein (TIGR03435 family)
MATPSPHHACTVAAALATVTIVTSLAPLRAVASSQKPDTQATFEVVSIKENTSGPPNAGGDRFGTVFYPGGRFTARNATLNDLILAAYRDEFTASRISGVTDGMLQKRFDVEVRLKAGDVPAGETTRVPQQQLQLMVRSMLEDRFALRTRRGERSEEVHVLSIAPGGHKMTPATDASACGPATDQGGPRASECHMLRIGPKGLDGTAVDTSDIAGALQFHLQRPVIDDARLSGLYGVSASWNDVPGMHAALRERLGLRLDVERRPMPTLIVESAALPREK